MQVNNIKREINNVEFYMELKHIICGVIGDNLVYRDMEINIKNDDRLTFINIIKDGLMGSISLTKNLLEYELKLDESKMNRKYIYCTFDEVKDEEDFEKCKIQLKEDFKRLVHNIIYYDKEDIVEDILSINEFKYSSEYEVNNRNRYDYI